MADACVLWGGPFYATGYGRAYINSTGYGHCNGRCVLAHRLAYEEAHGPIPEGYQVHHTCGTRGCVNPEHMELLDVQSHAGAHGHGTLTRVDADRIKERLARGSRGIDVAASFGISPQQVCNIRKGRCWA
jgi:hypothetical protein